MVARNFFLLLLNCSAWVLLSEIFFGSTVLCSSLRTLITCTCLQVEDNTADAPAGCVIVMPGELDNGDDDEEDEDDNDERNSETAALTSSC